MLDDTEKRECFLRTASNGSGNNIARLLFEQNVKLLDDSVGFNNYVEGLINYAYEKGMVFVLDDFVPKACNMHRHVFPHQPDIGTKSVCLVGSELELLISHLIY